MGKVGYKTLAIDIETFSDVDLIKCGVYAYADSPAFEILLFAYSFDDEETKIIDLAQGEQLTEEIKNALSDWHQTRRCNFHDYHSGIAMPILAYRGGKINGKEAIQRPVSIQGQDWRGRCRKGYRQVCIRQDQERAGRGQAAGDRILYRRNRAGR